MTFLTQIYEFNTTDIQIEPNYQIMILLISNSDTKVMYFWNISIIFVKHYKTILQ